MFIYHPDLHLEHIENIFKIFQNELIHYVHPIISEKFINIKGNAVKRIFNR